METIGDKLYTQTDDAIFNVGFYFWRTIFNIFMLEVYLYNLYSNCLNGKSLFSSISAMCSLY